MWQYNLLAQIRDRRTRFDASRGRRERRRIRTDAMRNKRLAGARGSRTHRANRRVAANGVEDRRSHQAPSAPVCMSWQNASDETFKVSR